MPSITTALTINNAAAVAKTFAIASKNPAETLFEERSAGIQSQFISLRVRGQKPAGNRKFSRVEYKTVLPIVRAVNGVNTVVDFCEGITAYKCGEIATAVERADVFAYHVNGMNHASLKPVAVDLDFVY